MSTKKFTTAQMLAIRKKDPATADFLQKEMDRSVQEDILAKEINTIKGAQGDKGDQGVQGDQGIQGDKGDKGDRGLEGKKGEIGGKGDKGERGEDASMIGPKGDSGNDGSPGLKGDKGDKGKDGSPDTAKQIADKVNTLDKKIDFKVLKNVPRTLGRGSGGEPYLSGGGKLIVQDEGITLNENVTSLDFTGTGVTATNDGRNVTVDITGGGETNTMSNLGGGEGVFFQKDGVDFELKSLIGGDHMTLSSDNDEITFDVDDDFLLNTGDTGTGAYDFGGADSFEIPNSTISSIDTDGEIEVDTLVNGFSHGTFNYYSGEKLVTIAMPISQIASPNDGEVPTYNSTAQEFQLMPTGSGDTNFFNDTKTDQSGGTSDTYGVIVGAIDGVNTTYTVSESVYVSGTLRVYLNGQLQTQGTGEDWVETTPGSGTFDFNTAPTGGDEITAQYIVSESSSTSFANINLSNLGATAINTTLASDTDITDDLGTPSKQWNTLYIKDVIASGDISADNLNLAGLSSGSTDTAKSLYTMTSAVDVEFETSDNNTLLYLDEANERVGIGTDSPDTKLHISQTAISGRETFMKVDLSDAGNDQFGIANGTSGDGAFAPSFYAYKESGNNLYSMGLRAMTDAGSDASDSAVFGLLHMEMFRTDSATDPNNGTFSTIQNRKLLTIYNGSDTGKEKLIMNAAGYVMLGGDTDPDERLVVSGAVKSLDASGTYTKFVAGTNDLYARGSFVIGSDQGDSINNAGFTINPDVSSGVQKDTFMEIRTNPVNSVATKRFFTFQETDVAKIVTASNDGNDVGTPLWFGTQGTGGTAGLYIDNTSAQNVGIGKEAVSKFHTYENTTETGASTGLTIEQEGTGDAILQYLLTGTRRWVSGIDNSDGDKYKISSSADLGTNTRFSIDINGIVEIPGEISVGGTGTFGQINTDYIADSGNILAFDVSSRGLYDGNENIVIDFSGAGGDPIYMYNNVNMDGYDLSLSSLSSSNILLDVCGVYINCAENWIDDGNQKMSVHPALRQLGDSSSNVMLEWGNGNIDAKANDIVTTGNGEFEDVTINGELGAELDAGAHSIGFTMQTATGDGTTTIDWKLGNHFDFTFGAQNETFTFTAPSKSGVYTLSLKQDSTGSRTATWPATVKWAGGTAPTLTTTATTGKDIISFRFDGTNYDAVASLDFS